MLPDYKNALIFTPLKFRHVHTLIVHVTHVSGTAALDTATSSPNITLVSAVAGVYSFTCPKGSTLLHPYGAMVDPAAEPIAANVASYAYIRAVNALAGTFRVVTTDNAGVELNVATDGHLFATLLLGRA